jgi:type II secretory pathway predicted ATPase ExeA
LYCRFFGASFQDNQRVLTRSPFGHASSVQRFYINDAYREAFVAVRYGIELRLGLVVLSGEPGVGKTSLLKLVRESAKKNVRLVMLSARAERATSLVDCIMAPWNSNVPPERRAGIQALKKYLLQQSKAGQIVAILIDDADELDPENCAELKTLLSLRSDGRHLLQVVLVGGPALENAPGLKSLRQRIRVRSRIPPLTSHEVEAYIEYKLSSAGTVLRDLFRPSAVTRIATYSRGIPRTIDALCDRSLRLAYRRSEKKITESIVEDAWTIIQSGGEPTIEGRPDREQPRSQSNATPYAEAPQGAHGTASENLPGRETRPAARGMTALASAWRSWTARASQLLESIERFAPISTYGRWSLAHGSYQAIGAILIGAVAAAVMLRPALSPPPKPELVQQANALTEPGPTPPLLLDEPPAVPTEPLEASTTLVGGTMHDRSSAVSRRTGARSGELVYLHTTEPEDFRAVEDIGAVLRSEGYVVGDIIFTRNNTEGDVRFFFAADRQAAERVKSVVEAELQTRGYSRRLQLLERDGRKFRFATPRKLEVWLPALTQSAPR